MYLHCKFGLNLSLSEITLLFDLSLYLDRTLAQRKAQQKAKSKVKVTHYVITDEISDKLLPGQNTQPSQPHHLVDTDKTKHSYNHQQHKTRKNNTRKLLIYAQIKANETKAFCSIWPGNSKLMSRFLRAHQHN